MNELQKLESFRYSLAVAETFDEIKLIKDATQSFSELARLQNMSLEKQNEVGKFRIEITDKIGKWLDDNYPKGAKPGTNNRDVKSPNETLQMPVSKRESSNSRIISRNPELVQDVIEEIESNKDLITPNKVANKVKDIVESVEVEEIPPKNNFKSKTIMLYNLEGHEDSEINTVMIILRNMTQYYNKKDFKGFKGWAENYLEILINNYEK